MEKVNEIISIMLRIEDRLGAIEGKLTRRRREPAPASPEYGEYLKLYNELFNTKRRGSEKTQRQFNARMDEGYTIDDFRSAIEGAKKEQIHVDSKFKWLTTEFFTRSEKLERYVSLKKETKKHFATYDDVKKD